MTHFYPDSSYSSFQYVKALIFGLFFFLLFLGLSHWSLLIPMVYLPVIIFKKEGIEIDDIKQRFRRTSRPRASKKPWEKANDFEGVVIKKFLGKKIVRGGVTMPSAGITAQTESYNVFIMDSTHRQQVFITECKTYSNALEKAKTISKQTGLPIQAFNPKVISKHPRRRR